MADGNPLLREVTSRLHGTIELTVVTVGTSELPLPATPLKGRKYVIIQNKTGGSLFIGPSDVTSATGIELTSGAIERIELGRAELYGIRASGSGDVHVLEFA